jgi:formate hydrogenlyase subunit 3/multisubunit Na+/H+ antiporter MnhD subunit
MQALVLLWCILSLLGVAVVAILLGSYRITSSLTYGMTAVVSAVMCVVAGMSIGAVQSPAVALPLGLPWIGAEFLVDPLSAFFLVIVNLGGLVASVYALGYGRHEPSPRRVLPFFPAFLAGMTLVLLAADAFSFLVSWEFMSLTSWALVLSHHRDENNQRAGYVYILMASLGTFALLLAFGLLAGSEGHYAFAMMRGQSLPPSYASLVLLLALLGAGSKAGVLPLHVWLPLAHPAAPSHVSALMSGVMTKVAIYTVIRILFDLAGPPQWWWGLIIILLGGATALMGVLYALFQTDMKRILAYSTIENIGIIFAGLGLALSFRVDHFGAAAALAFTAALFHAFNHSLFKSLMFFGSGAVLTATGERDMDKLGGLIHRMPVTALAVLGGAAAISALPPWNGFVSEWLTFQTILLSPELPQWGLRLFVPATGALLALSVALAGACFVRFYGITFLGRPRSAAAGQARETDRWSHGVMLALAALCLAIGLLPGYVIDLMAPVTQSLLGTHMPQQSSVAWLSLIPINKARSSYNGLLVFLFIAASASLAAYAIHRLASKATRRAPIWACGFPELSPTAQYTAASFAQPIRRVFGPLLFRAQEQVDMPPPGSMAPARFRIRLDDIIWNMLYLPIAEGVRAATDQLNVLQFLTIRRYLSLVFGVLVVLLLVIAIWR